MSITALRDEDPRALGRYRLTNRLGGGAMGVVYLGHGPDGTAVAIKTLRAGVGDEVRARFRREAELLGRLSTPRVSGYVDSDTAAEAPWLAMRYVEGPSLAAASTPVDAQVLRQLALGLAQALVAVHAVGIVHRDVKPGNVVLTYDGPVLVDLGIATHGDLSSLTVAGLTIGTPSFMAPEQLSGEPVTPATDMWGWASVVVYAVTGHSPFGDDAVELIAYRVRNERPRGLERLPAELRPLAEAALTRDPARRPSAATVLAALGAPAGGPAGDATLAPGAPVIHGGPTGPVAHSGPTGPVAHSGPTGPVAHGALVDQGGATAPHQPPIAPTLPRPAQRRSRHPAVLVGVAVLVIAVVAGVLVAVLRHGSDGSPQGARTSGPGSSSAGGPTPAAWPPLTDVLVAAKAGVTQPAFPTAVDGYEFSTSKTVTVRTFIGGAYAWDIDETFPATMNNCSQKRFYVRWRSINTTATVSSTFVTTETSPTPERTPVSGAVGHMSGDSCGQPGFHLTSTADGGSTLADIVMTYQVWTPTA